MSRVVRLTDALETVEHRLRVPLVHDRPDERTLTLFAREVRAADEDAPRPYLLFLQGGPGGEPPRPGPTQHGWMDRALRDFRLLLLDQRGTGLSSPIGELAAMAPPEQAEYLSHFRADAIVRDAELLREHLGLDRWSLLGQSFGGFCSLTYLSRFPDRLASVFFTGGLPPVGVTVDEMYAATYAQMTRLTERYYERFPEDRDRVRALAARCDAGEVVLPTGEAISAEHLRSLGSRLGFQGGAEDLHFLLERDPDSRAFRHDLAGSLPFSGRDPLYLLVHEACCADGGATRWSSERVRPAAYDADPTLLTAEHPRRCHVEETAELRPFREAADLLAEWEWPRLYDEDVLRRADVPCAAAIYQHDPYVLADLSRATADLLPGMHPWVTADHEHNALRQSGEEVLDTLFGLVSS